MYLMLTDGCRNAVRSALWSHVRLSSSVEGPMKGVREGEDERSKMNK